MFFDEVDGRKRMPYLMPPEIQNPPIWRLISKFIK